MADRAIKGITLEIGGNTIQLQESLRAVESRIGSLSTEANQINKALKFDPTNTELLSQKISVLSEQFSSVSEKLKALKSNQDTVNKGFDATGKALTPEQIRAYNREVEITQGILKGLETNLDRTAKELREGRTEFAGAGNAVKSFKDDLEDAGEESSTFTDVLKANLTSQAITGAIDGLISKIKDIGSGFIEAAAGVRAENAQFESAFGDLKDSAVSSFKSISGETGVLAERLKIVGTQAFSQFKGAGIEASEALKVTSDFTKMAADAAAYYDISIEEASEKLRSFTRGNAQAGDSIGLFTSESQRNERAVALLGEKYINLTEAQKQMVMMDIAGSIYKVNGAMGQAAREADGYENVMGNLNEQWRQIQASMGTALLETITPKIQEITREMGGLDEVAKDMGEGIANVVGFILDNAGAITATIATITAAITASKIADFVGSIANLTNPVGLAAGAVGLLSAGAITLYNHLNSANEELLKTGERLDGVVSAANEASESFSNVSQQIEHWRELKKSIDDNEVATSDLRLSTEELAKAKEELSRVEAILAGNSDGLISQFALENGLTQEQIKLIEELNRIKKEQAIRDLETELRNTDYSGIQKGIEEAKGQLQILEQQYDLQVDAYAKLGDLSDRFSEFINSGIDMETAAWSDGISSLNSEFNELASVLGINADAAWISAMATGNLVEALGTAETAISETNEATKQASETLGTHTESQSKAMQAEAELSYLKGESTKATKDATKAQKDGVKTISEVIDQYFAATEATKTLTSAYDKLIDGVDLSKGELEYIVEMFPEIAQKIEKTGVASVNASDIILAANGKIIFSSEKKRQAAISDAKASIQAAEEEARRIVESYENERKAIVAIINARMLAGQTASGFERDLAFMDEAYERNAKAAEENVKKSKEALAAIEAIGVISEKSSKGTSKSAKETKEVNKDLQEQMKLLEDRKALSEVSADEEIAALEEIRQRYAKTEEEKIEIDKKTYALRKKNAEQAKKDEEALNRDLTKAIEIQYQEEYETKKESFEKSLELTKKAMYSEVEILSQRPHKVKELTDEEFAEFQELSNLKIEMFDREYIESLRLIDEKTAAALEGANAEIDKQLELLWITNSALAEEITAKRNANKELQAEYDKNAETRRKQQEDEKRAALELAIINAQTAEELDRAQNALSSWEAELSFNERQKELQEAIKANNSSITQLQKEAKANTEDVKKNIKDSIGGGNESLKELSNTLNDDLKDLSKKYEELKENASSVAAALVKSGEEGQRSALLIMEKFYPQWRKSGYSFISELDQGRAEGEAALVDGMENTGVMTMQGFLDGIKSKEAEIIAEAGRIADLVRQTISNSLDMHSPSRVMMALGENTGIGFSTGIESTLGIIERAARRLGLAAIPKVAATGNIPIAPIATGNITGAAVKINLIVDKFYNNSDRDIEEISEKLAFATSQALNGRGGR